MKDLQPVNEKRVVQNVLKILSLTLAVGPA